MGDDAGAVADQRTDPPAARHTAAAHAEVADHGAPVSAEKQSRIVGIAGDGETEQLMAEAVEPTADAQGTQRRLAGGAAPVHIRRQRVAAVDGAARRWTDGFQFGQGTDQRVGRAVDAVALPASREIHAPGEAAGRQRHSHAAVGSGRVGFKRQAGRARGRHHRIHVHAARRRRQRERVRAPVHRVVDDDVARRRGERDVAVGELRRQARAGDVAAAGRDHVVGERGWREERHERGEKAQASGRFHGEVLGFIGRRRRSRRGTARSSRCRAAPGAPRRRT